MTTRHQGADTDSQRLAIVGVGHTEQGKLPGRAANSLALEAAQAALQDAGLTWADVDGFVSGPSYGGGGIDVDLVRQGRLDLSYASSLTYGTCNFSLQTALGALRAGLAEVFVLCYGTNQKSAGNTFAAAPDGLDAYHEAVGYVNIAGPAALAFQRHQALYGTREDQLGRISVAQRRWAELNPNAIFQSPMTLDDYLDQRYIVRPLRRPDICMISDGGVALVVTSERVARRLTPDPIVVLGTGQVVGSGMSKSPENLMRPWIRELGSRIYGQAGVSRDDIDILYMQDPTSVWVLQMLEAYGFCGVGEAGEFLEDHDLGPGGTFPVNTNGGQLSESYMWGWLHLVEAVRQLRGEGGPRQVPDARVIQYSSTMAFEKAASSIIART